MAGEFGAQCVVVAIDAAHGEPTDHWEVFTHGGRQVRPASTRQLGTHMRRPRGGEILVTSIDRDGTEAGYDLELTRPDRRLGAVPVIASGGVGTLEHLVEGPRVGHADGLIASSIFHFGRHTVTEAKEFLAAAGVASGHPGA